MRLQSMWPKGYLPEEVVFWGAQIESLGVGLALSPAVAAQMDALGEKVLGELARWGIEPQEKGRPRGGGRR